MLYVKCFNGYIMCTRPPLWSSGQSSWLQIQRSGFDSRCYQVFCEVVGLERGPLSLVSTTEELTNSVALVRELTIPTERPLLVGEVSANFCG
jgi:hypothetical protein